MPTTCPDVPGDLLDSRGQWADPARYDAQAVKLARRVREAFQPFAATVSPEVLVAEASSRRLAEGVEGADRRDDENEVGDHAHD